MTHRFKIYTNRDIDKLIDISGELNLATNKFAIIKYICFNLSKIELPNILKTPFINKVEFNL